MEREKLTLTKEEAQELIYGTAEFDVVEDVIEDTTRWSEIHHIVVQRKSDGKYFADGYSCGATEMQDESPWEYSDPDFTEVFPQETVVIKYV